MARNTVGTGTGADVSISCLPDFDSFMFVSWHGLGVKGRICCVQCLVFATYVLSPEIIVFFLFSQFSLLLFGLNFLSIYLSVATPQVWTLGVINAKQAKQLTP